MEKFINKYIKDVKKCITLNSKEEKEFMKGFKNDVLSAYDNEEFKTHDELIDVFGYPNEVAASYIKTISNQQISKYMKNKKIYIALLAVLILSSIFIYTFKNHRLNQLISEAQAYKQEEFN